MDQKQVKNQQRILDFVRPAEKAKEFIERGEPLFAWVWQEMIKHNSVSFPQVIELAELAVEKDVWLPDEVLVYIMEHQDEIEERGLLKRIFTKKKSNSVLEFFNRYHEKHPEVPWSDAFVLTALKRADFKELFLHFKFGLSADAEVELVKRDDFIAIIGEWPWEKFYLKPKAQQELVNQPFAKLLAYTKKARGLEVFGEFIASDGFTVEKAIQLLQSMKDLSLYLSKDDRHQLLAQKHSQLTELVVKALRWDSTFELEDQQLILATPQPSAAISAYAKPTNCLVKARVFDVSLQSEVLQILQEQAPTKLRKYVNCLLTSDAEHLNADFVTWLSRQPNSFISNLGWKQELGTGVDFWLNTLETTKTALFMKAYKSATVNKHEGRRHDPARNVIIKMLDCPNAPELVAIWDRQAGVHEHIPFGECRPWYSYDDNHYHWEEEELKAIAKLPQDEFMAIYNIAGSLLKSGLDRYRQ